MGNADELSENAAKITTVYLIGFIAFLFIQIKQSLFEDLGLLFIVVILLAMMAGITFWIIYAIYFIIFLISKLLEWIFTLDFNDIPHEFFLYSLFIFFLIFTTPFVYPFTKSMFPIQKLEIPESLPPISINLLETPTSQNALSETSTPTAIITPDKETYETTWQDDEHIRALDQNGFLNIGSMYLDYRYGMFSVNIEIPREYDNLRLLSFERIFLPFDSTGNKQLATPYFRLIPRFVQSPVDCFYSQNVLVYPIIDVQLKSEDFEIISLEPDAPKILNVTDEYPNVSWGWTIRKHDFYSSKGSISLSLFLDEISEPSWSCTFFIELLR